MTGKLTELTGKSAELAKLTKLESGDLRLRERINTLPKQILSTQPIQPTQSTLQSTFMNYWLVKQEPEKYSFDDLLKDSATAWDGVRNFQARNNLRLMRMGDQVLFYHSVSEKSVVGLAEVSRQEFPDPADEKWICVEIKPVGKFAKVVTLEQIKAEKTLENVGLIKQSRLSVMPLAKSEFEFIVELSK